MTGGVEMGDTVDVKVEGRDPELETGPQTFSEPGVVLTNEEEGGIEMNIENVSVPVWKALIGLYHIREPEEDEDEEDYRPSMTDSVFVQADDFNTAAKIAREWGEAHAKEFEYSAWDLVGLVEDEPLEYIRAVPGPTVTMGGGGSMTE